MKNKSLLLFLLAASWGNAQATSIQCIKNDFGLLEPTMAWRNTLGALAEKTCNEANFKISGKAPVVVAPKDELAIINTPSNQPILSIKNDKSVMQLINRWAIQTGYKLMLNGEVVSPQFPKHTVRYLDIPISKVKSLEPTIGFPVAIALIQKSLDAPSFKKLDFQVNIDQKAKTAIIQINEKH